MSFYLYHRALLDDELSECNFSHRKPFALLGMACDLARLSQSRDSGESSVHLSLHAQSPIIQARTVQHCVAIQSQSSLKFETLLMLSLSNFTSSLLFNKFCMISCQRALDNVQVQCKTVVGIRTSVLRTLRRKISKVCDEYIYTRITSICPLMCPERVCSIYPYFSLNVV